MKRQTQIKEHVLSSYHKMIRGHAHFNQVPARYRRRCLAMNHRVEIVLIRIRMGFPENK